MCVYIYVCVCVCAQNCSSSAYCCIMILILPSFFAGANINEVSSMVENHLKSVILKTFDPKKADTIFNEEGDVSFFYHFGILQIMYICFLSME